MQYLFGEDEVKLVEIVAQMERWYECAYQLFDIPFVTHCFMPPMLAYCICQARGLMALSNWLRNYNIGPDLEPDQVHRGWNIPFPDSVNKGAVKEISPNEIPPLPAAS